MGGVIPVEDRALDLVVCQDQLQVVLFKRIVGTLGPADTVEVGQDFFI